MTARLDAIHQEAHRVHVMHEHAQQLFDLVELQTDLCARCEGTGHHLVARQTITRTACQQCSVARSLLKKIRAAILLPPTKEPKR